MKKALIGMVVILALVITMVLTVGLKESGEVKAFDRAAVNIGEVKDGVYEGCSETTLVKVQVRVTVSDGKIDNIEILKHECGKGMPANAIVEEMVSRNDVEVDTVSGATVSSEVIKDAVRNALREGK